MVWPAIIAAGAGIGAAVGAATKYTAEGIPIDNFKRKGPTGANYRTFADTASERGNIGVNQEFRNEQSGLMAMLQARAAGTAPSAAEMQMQQGLEQNVASARSLAVSQQGVSPGMALRSAQEAASNANAANQQQTSILRAQEQAQAQSQYGEALSGARQQDMAAANFKFQQQQQRDQIVEMHMQRGLSVDQAEQQAQMQLQQMRVNQDLAIQGINAGQATSQQQFMAGLAGAGASAAGAAASGAGAMMSDRNAKKKIKRSKKELDKLMNNLKAYSYDYKDEKNGKGKHISVMAQDLEKSTLGKLMVSKNEEGTKIVNYGKGLASMLAGVARLNERINELEGAK